MSIVLIIVAVWLGNEFTALVGWITSTIGEFFLPSLRRCSCRCPDCGCEV